MKRISIFSVGKHTSMNGEEIEFKEDTLKAIVNSYNKNLHHAPIVVGHPKTDSPAYGWVSSLEYQDGLIWANVEHVNKDFEAMVRSGAYKKRSASFYPPNVKNNPVPSSFYLKHVGFLGGVPPAVKGLPDIHFSQDDEDICFDFTEDNEESILKGLLSQLKRWINFNERENPCVIPEEIIDDVIKNQEKENTMSIEELKIMQQRLEEAEKKAEEAERQLKNFSEESRKDKINEKVEQLIKKGCLAPAQKTKAVQFALAQSTTHQSFDFGQHILNSSAEDLFFDLLESMPRVVEFNELASEKGVSIDNDVSYQERIEELTEEFQSQGMEHFEAYQKATKQADKERI